MPEMNDFLASQSVQPFLKLMENGKNEDFLISSISTTPMILKV